MSVYCQQLRDHLKCIKWFCKCSFLWKDQRKYKLQRGLSNVDEEENNLEASVKLKYKAFIGGVRFSPCLSLLM